MCRIVHGRERQMYFHFQPLATECAVPGVRIVVCLFKTGLQQLFKGSFAVLTAGHDVKVTHTAVFGMRIVLCGRSPFENNIWHMDRQTVLCINIPAIMRYLSSNSCFPIMAQIPGQDKPVKNGCGKRGDPVGFHLLKNRSVNAGNCISP